MSIDMRMYRCDHSHEPCHTHMNVQMCTFGPACYRLAGSMPLLTSRLAGCTDLYKRVTKKSNAATGCYTCYTCYT